MVTKYRNVTRYRTATRRVTRYRTEVREEEYPAIRRSVEYTNDWHLEVGMNGDQEGASPLRLRVRDAERDVDHDHDTTVEAADVYPSRANLIARSDVMKRLFRATVKAAAGHFGARWSERFCSNVTSDEQAARCLRGGQSPSRQTVQHLNTFFGARDTAILIENL